jgi:hypothetical protein
MEQVRFNINIRQILRTVKTQDIRGESFGKIFTVGPYFSRFRYVV